MCRRMLFWAFTPKIARIHREDKLSSMRTNITRAMSQKACVSVTVLLLCVATSTANLVVHTKARSRKTKATPTKVLRVVCRRCPLSSCAK